QQRVGVALAQQRGGLGLDRLQRRGRRGRRRRLLAGAAALQAVQARRRETVGREERVEGFDPAAAHQRQGAIEHPRQFVQAVDDRGGDADPVGLVGEGRQRAVDVEEQRPLVGQRGWRRQWGG